jgi:hypothetical protein
MQVVSSGPELSRMFQQLDSNIYNCGCVMEKRRHLRIAVKNLPVGINDGVGYFQGMVSDVSRFGICMTDLPQQINGDAKRMTIVISAKEGHFKMNIRPRWYTHDSATRSAGVEIITVPLGWTEFVMNLEPELHKDEWVEIRL